MFTQTFKHSSFFYQHTQKKSILLSKEECIKKDRVFTLASNQAQYLGTMKDPPMHQLQNGIELGFRVQTELIMHEIRLRIFLASKRRISLENWVDFLCISLNGRL